MCRAGLPADPQAPEPLPHRLRGRISHLKRGYGLRRSRLKGGRDQQIWTGLGGSGLQPRHPRHPYRLTAPATVAEHPLPQQVLTTECVGEFLGIDTDRGLYEHFRRYWRDWFPALGRSTAPPSCGRRRIRGVGLMLDRALLYARWSDWAGGVSWGPRFLMPAVAGGVVSVARRHAYVHSLGDSAIAYNLHHLDGDVRPGPWSTSAAAPTRSGFSPWPRRSWRPWPPGSWPARTQPPRTPAPKPGPRRGHGSLVRFAPRTCLTRRGPGGRRRRSRRRSGPR